MPARGSRPPLRRTVLAVLGLIALAALSRPSAAQGERGPPQAPMLRVETGAHTARIAHLAADASGRLLATASDDKTLRLWSLPDGTPRGVLRPPIGAAEEGELYAVALSPDGRTAFAAGSTGRQWDGSNSIYVFDVRAGRLSGLLSGLPAPVAHLALSPDGSRLAAALNGRAGVRVWDARSGRELFADADYAGPARWVAFDAAGRLAAAAADGRVRVYDAAGRKLADRSPLAGARPFGLAVSPDGGLLAVGYEDRLRVDILSLPDLRPVAAPDTAGLAGEGLPTVAWASDGRGGVQLYAAGYARAAPPGTGGRGTRVAPATTPAGAAEGAGTGRGFVVRRWADFGLGGFRDIAAARDAVTQLLPLPGGGLAFAAADPGWGRIAPDGALAAAPRPNTADFRRTGAALRIAADASRARFALRPGEPALVFDARAGTLLADDGAAGAAEDWLAARAEMPRQSVADWRDRDRPKLNGQPLRLDPGEFSRAASLLPDGSGLLLGTDTHLRLFDARGAALDALAVPGTAWGVVVAADGRGAVAALGDGTLRWYGLEGGRIAERAALFVHADARRWALWTPEGFFDHAPGGGQELVGVHLNGARNRTPEWASFQQAYRALYAPAAVRARLVGAAPAAGALAGLRDRIGRTPAVAPAALCAVVGKDCAPLDWDAAVLPAGARALRVGVSARDRGLGLGPLDVLVNGRIASRADAAAGGAVAEVALDPGVNRVSTRLYSGDRALFAEGPSLEVRREDDGADAAAGDGLPAGRLIVLSVGVNRYASRSLDLRFAVPDAEAVAAELRARGAGVFKAVETVLLRDAEASRAGILAALERVAEQARPEDTFVFYLAGHGVRADDDGRFLFLPADLADTSSWQSVRRAALDDDALIAAIARIRARDGFLLIDTCFAGQVALDGLSAMGNETGRYLLAASSSVQEALDSYDDRNGVFAFALREGLRGRAAADGEGRVSALALGEFVARRVPRLAAEKGHRQDAVFRSASRDLRGFPMGAVPR